MVILLTLVLAVHLDRLEQNRTVATFEGFADDGLEKLVGRLDGFVRTLDGTTGLIDASGDVTAQDWERYVAAIDIETQLPGTLGIGYIALVTDANGAGMTEFLAQRGADFPPVYPDTGQDERFVIQFIEPMRDNQSALGLDVSFEPGRRNAAQTARDTNSVQLTPPIELVQAEARNTGFLLLMPHYKMGAPLDTPAQLDAAFQGWAYMPFVGEALFQSLTSQQDRFATLTVRDGIGAGQSQYVYDTLPEDAASTSLYQASREIEVFGRTWTLMWNSTPAFETAYATFTKWIVLALGLIVSALIALTFQMVMRKEQLIATEVRRKTKEIRAKNEQTQSVIDNAVLSIFVLDENENIISANQAAKDLFGEQNIMIGTPLGFIIKITDVSDNLLGDARPARAPNFPDLRLLVDENEWSTADGSRRKTVLIQDVSAAEMNAHMLQETEARWNMALAGAQIGVFDVDLTTQTSVVSDTWRKLMQVPMDATQLDAQKMFFSRIHPDDVKILKAADNDCIEGRTDRSIAQYRMRFEDGSYRWMQSDAVVVKRDANGKALRLLGAQTDVTDLREARDSLKQSRERFELVLDQAPVGMALFDYKGNFQGMNGALCAMSGYTMEELNSGMQFRNLISKTDLTKLMKCLDELKLQKQTAHQGEYQIIPKTGPPVWGLFSVALTSDPATGRDAFIVQINDINEQKNIEKIKSEFVATVSHELRTPLTSIKGALGLMRGPMLDKMPVGAGRLLEIAAANTDRLSALVNDILDMEKISSGEVDFHIAPHSISQLLKDGMEQMLPFAVQHKVKLALSLPKTNVQTRIDPQRTQQLIANLISNACKYSDADTTVDIRLEVIAGQALVCVANQGPPIPDEFKTRIFRPFSQADGSDTRVEGGTGLGLNISRQIVERMDGKIGFDSKPNSPTVFWFTVPAVQNVDTVMPSAPTDGVTKTRINVLHLEDDSDFIEIVRTGLGALANVTPALTLKDARRAMRENVFDVLIIDWELPDGHGSELFADVAKYQPHAKTIILSANGDSIGDLKVDYEMVKSRTDLDDIVTNVVKFAKVAS